VRLFVALAVPDEVRALVDGALAPLRRRHPRLRWTRPESWHVTCAFLGEVADDRREEVVSVVRTAVGASGPARSLALGEPGTFGGRTAWLRVVDEPAGRVVALGERLQTALAGAELPVETREVHPHLTVARTRGRARLPDGLVAELPRPDARWVPERVTLWRSHIGADGARHEALAHVDWG
jgi:RNA 2',3'-cyclic 3'-phosphodiesterase